MIGQLSVTVSGSTEGTILINVTVFVVIVLALLQGRPASRAAIRVISPLCCLDPRKVRYHP